jgi:hypothetical protein
MKGKWLICYQYSLLKNNYKKILKNNDLNKKKKKVYS